MTDATTMDDEEEQARKHLSQVALGLSRKFGSPKAASLLFGAGAGVIEAGMGQSTATWLRELADVYDRDDDGGTV